MGGPQGRYIDFKAEMLASPSDAEPPKVRDAVAVFSDSQLNALGLAAFLARTSRDRAGFVVLDDAVQASDDDHRAMFIRHVLEQLIKDGRQGIVLTYDPRTARDIQTTYQHLPLDMYHVVASDFRLGATVHKTDDQLEALLARAKTFAALNDPEARKEAAQVIRDAAERFCKELLVKSRRAKGDELAMTSDYAGKHLGELEKDVLPLLTDISHPGKLRMIARHCNPGDHDAPPPGTGDLKVALGDLTKLIKIYLSRT